MARTTRITEMYAWVCTDPLDNTEGVIATMGKNGMMLPLVGADTERAESLRPIAQMIGAEKELDVYLLRFTVREELDRIPAPPF